MSIHFLIFPKKLHGIKLPPHKEALYATGSKASQSRRSIPFSPCKSVPIILIYAHARPLHSLQSQFCKSVPTRVDKKEDNRENPRFSRVFSVVLTFQKSKNFKIKRGQMLFSTFHAKQDWQTTISGWTQQCRVRVFLSENILFRFPSRIAKSYFWY